MDTLSELVDEELAELDEIVTEAQKKRGTAHWNKVSCRCSNCNYGITYTKMVSEEYKFCPNCGFEIDYSKTFNFYSKKG